MPSLRRSVSSPVVRASPYHSALSDAHSPHAAGGSRPRRTASYTTGRRVLADIEWWRVHDGQHIEEPELEQDQDVRLGQDDVEAGVGSFDQDHLRDADVGIVRPSTPVNSRMVLEEYPEASSLMTPFALLSISAMVPSTPPRSRHSLDASSSSTESTPEQPPHIEVYADSLDGLEGLGRGLAPRPSMIHAMRSLSFAGFPTPHSPTDDRFGDVVFI